MNNKLLFFDKEGYPYNFRNTDTGAYEGKIYFDHNSSDTYKTVGMYIFEEVEPIEFIETVKLNKIEIFNQSGITFSPSGQVTGATISNITRVNSSPAFRSKWIHGTSFDQLFPVGTIVSFKNILLSPPSSDFNNAYYTVLDNKRDAILVTTSTVNSTWTNTFISGSIISHDNILVNDYDNTLIPSIASHTFHTNKKLNVVDSTSNDGIKTFTMSGTTTTMYHQYDISGNTGDIVNIDLTLLTERPRIYQGGANFVISGSTAIITFDRDINSSFLLDEGQQVIFEDMYDNPIHPLNPTFTINDGGTEYDISNGVTIFERTENTIHTTLNTFNGTSTKVKYDYSIKIKGEPLNALTKGDIIQLSGTTGTSGHKNNNRSLTVESYRSFRNMRIDYWAGVISSDQNWMNDVRVQAVRNTRPVSTQLELESIKMYNDNDNNPSSSSYIKPVDRYNYIKVVEYVIPESIENSYRINKIINKTRTLYCSVSTSLIYSTFTMDVIAYGTSNVITMTQEVLHDTGGTRDYNATINTMNNKYASLLTSLGLYAFYDGKLKIVSRLSGNYLTTTLRINGVTRTNSNTVNTLNLSVSDKLISEEVRLDQTSSFVINYHSGVILNLNSNNTSNGFTLFAIDFEYYVNFNTDTTTTINDFISLYYDVFDRNGITISLSGSNTLNIDGKYPNVNVYSLGVKVNSLSSYEIVGTVVGDGIFITGNELELSSGDFSKYGVSTGMIITVTGSTYPLNNKQYNIIGIGSAQRPNSIIELSYQGAFFGGGAETLTFKTERFLRKPRESYNRDVYYSLRFDMTEEDTQVINDIFFYDISGDNLKPYAGDDRLTYTGPKPLWDVNSDCTGNVTLLIDEANKNPDWVNDPTKQQTVFRGKDGSYVMNFRLDKYSDSASYDYVPEPLQFFLGFNSPDEGVSRSTVVMDKIDTVVMTGYTDSTDHQTGVHFTFSDAGELTMTDATGLMSYVGTGFEVGQVVSVDFVDTRPQNTIIFQNYGSYNVIGVTGNKLTLSSVGGNVPVQFTTTGSTYSYQYTIKTLPVPILTMQLLGSTEIEDERYRVGMKNLGLRLDIDDEHIFKQSDIKEHGYDYVLLNQKRKELLTMYPEIYNYIGSYKAVINSINFFGWNDLELNEYYRNVDPGSVLYQKLTRVRIPDIFDNTVEGWTSNDWVSGKYNDGKWKKTSLFNLTYNITDEEGNNILLYSLDEVQVKLNKLKRWLRKNMMPLSTNLVDITGVASTVSNYYLQYDTSNTVKKTYSSSETTVVNFNVTSTLNFGTNYMFQVDFYTLNGFVPSGWTAKVQTFSKNRQGKLVPQKYYKIMRNDLEPFSFNIDRMTDQYIYIETNYTNGYGLGMTYNKMTNSSTFRNYLLVNNNYKIPKDYKYINAGENMGGYYYFDKDGYFYLSEERVNLTSRG